MENNANKEKWIDEVLGSTQGISRAQAGDNLFEKVSARLHRPRTEKTPWLPLKWAAAAVLLLMLNVGSVIYLTRSGGSGRDTTGSDPLAMEIQSVTTYNY